MTSEDIEKFRIFIKKFKNELLNDKQKALDFFVEVGIYNEKGELRKAYGGKDVESINYKVQDSCSNCKHSKRYLDMSIPCARLSCKHKAKEDKIGHVVREGICERYEKE